MTSVGSVRARRWPPGVTTGVGGFYLMMSGINVGVAAADPDTYATFADRGLFAFVRDGWADIVMANPRAWVFLLAAGEALIGVLLLLGGRPARVGWVAVLAFHVLLLPFGWGIWAYAVPAMGVFALLARRDWHRLRGARSAPVRRPARRDAEPRAR